MTLSVYFILILTKNCSLTLTVGGMECATLIFLAGVVVVVTSGDAAAVIPGGMEIIVRYLRN